MGTGAHPQVDPPAAATPGRRLPQLLRSSGSGRWSRTRAERTTTDWVIDAIVVVLVIAGGIAVIVDYQGRPDLPAGWLQTFDKVALPVAAILLLWRRRWPVQVALAIAALSALSGSVAVATVFAIFALGRYCQPREAVLGIAAMLLPAPLTLAIWPPPDGLLPAVIFSVLITLGVGAWGMFTGTRAELLDALRERAERAEREQELQVAQARQQERTRIAREMHDVLAHRMALLSLHAGALEYRPDAPDADVARAAGVIRATAHDALEELRAVIGVLRVDDLLAADDRAARDDTQRGRQVADGAAHRQSPSAVPEPPQPTLADVGALVEDWREAGARIEVQLDLGQVTAAQVPVTLGRTAYRIVQEGLTNAGKHAPGARVQVAISGEPGVQLQVRVVNPRPVGAALARAAQLGGGAAIPGTGVGLIGLRERTEVVGGHLRCGELPSGEFELLAVMPWGVGAAAEAA